MYSSNESKINIDKFIEELSSCLPFTDTSLNVYQGDTSEAQIKKENLRFYLLNMYQIHPTRLIIGEAPGRWGCFLSGVPFTDEYTIRTHPFFSKLKKNIPNGKSQKEASASVVWNCLSKIPLEDWPLMWNIYPFHPSNVNYQYTQASERENRQPSRAECLEGLRILDALLKCFEIEQIYAVGRTAENTLKPYYPEVKYIRHPSHGGAGEFKRMFMEIV